VQQSINELHEQGIKRIICVSHNGYLEDQDVASRTKGIHAIIGGHSHTLLLNNETLNPAGPYPTKVTGLDGNAVYIVQAHRYGDYLGHLDLEWDNEGNLISISGQPILLDQNVKQDPIMKAKVANWAKKFDELTKDIVTTATDTFRNSCISGECPMGNMMSDCILTEHKLKGLNADVAMINSGGIRAAFQRGPVTVADIYTVSPFGNSVVQFKWTGEQIMDTLNRVKNGKSSNGKPLVSLPQFSGLKYNFKNGTEKSIANVMIGGKPLDLKATYDALSIDFVTDGGDSIMEKINSVSGDLFAEVMVNCLRRQPTITPSTDGRFTVVQ
jgi:5'-nucleotidase